MSDEAALLAAICAEPDDDTPRLAFADWLDEHERHLQAEFIRLQIRLARLARDAPERAALLWREKVIMAGPVEKWLGEIWGLRPIACAAVFLGDPPTYGVGGLNETGYPEFDVAIVRGFVANVLTSWDAWHLRADATLKRHPLQLVQFQNEPDPMQLRERLKKLPGGVEKEGELSKWYSTWSRLEHPERYREYLSRLCTAVWPTLKFEIPEL